jgi:hypothetical protein
MQTHVETELRLGNVVERITVRDTNRLRVEETVDELANENADVPEVDAFTQKRGRVAFDVPQTEVEGTSFVLDNPDPNQSSNE